MFAIVLASIEKSKLACQLLVLPVCYVVSDGGGRVCIDIGPRYDYGNHSIAESLCEFDNKVDVFEWATRNVDSTWDRDMVGLLYRHGDRVRTQRAVACGRVDGCIHHWDDISALSRGASGVEHPVARHWKRPWDLYVTDAWCGMADSLVWGIDAILAGLARAISPTGIFVAEDDVSPVVERPPYTSRYSAELQEAFRRVPLYTFDSADRAPAGTLGDFAVWPATWHTLDYCISLLCNGEGLPRTDANGEGLPRIDAAGKRTASPDPADSYIEICGTDHSRVVGYRPPECEQFADEIKSVGLLFDHQQLSWIMCKS